MERDSIVGNGIEVAISKISSNNGTKLAEHQAIAKNLDTECFLGQNILQIEKNIFPLHPHFKVLCTVHSSSG